MKNAIQFEGYVKTRKCLLSHFFHSFFQFESSSATLLFRESKIINYRVNKLDSLRLYKYIVLSYWVRELKWKTKFAEAKNCYTSLTSSGLLTHHLIWCIIHHLMILYIIFQLAWVCPCVLRSYLPFVGEQIAYIAEQYPMVSSSSPTFHWTFFLPDSRNSKLSKLKR